MWIGKETSVHARLILLDELFSVCQLVACREEETGLRVHFQQALGPGAMAELLVSIFQHLVVSFGVQAIHSHTCDLIEEVLCLDLNTTQGTTWLHQVSAPA